MNDVRRNVWQKQAWPTSQRSATAQNDTQRFELQVSLVRASQKHSNFCNKTNKQAFICCFHSISLNNTQVSRYQSWYSGTNRLATLSLQSPYNSTAVLFFLFCFFPLQFRPIASSCCRNVTSYYWPQHVLSFLISSAKLANC